MFIHRRKVLSYFPMHGCSEHEWLLSSLQLHYFLQNQVKSTDFSFSRLFFWMNYYRDRVTTQNLFQKNTQLQCITVAATECLRVYFRLFYFFGWYSSSYLHVLQSDSSVWDPAVQAALSYKRYNCVFRMSKCVCVCVGVCECMRLWRYVWIGASLGDERTKLWMAASNEALVLRFFHWWIQQQPWSINCSVARAANSRTLRKKKQKLWIN